jgi:hypothetical protein
MIFSKGHKNFKRFNFFYSNLEIEIVYLLTYLYNPTGYVITGDRKYERCSPKGLNIVNLNP